MAVLKEWKTVYQKATTPPSSHALSLEPSFSFLSSIAASILCSIINGTSIILCTLTCCGIFSINVKYVSSFHSAELYSDCFEDATFSFGTFNLISSKALVNVMQISSRITTLGGCKQESSCLFVEGIDNPTCFKDLALFTDGFDPVVLIKYQNFKFFCKKVFLLQRCKTPGHHIHHIWI